MKKNKVKEEYEEMLEEYDQVAEVDISEEEIYEDEPSEDEDDLEMIDIENEEDDQDDEEKTSDKSKFIHIGFAILVVLIIGIMIFVIHKWDLGKKIKYTDEDIEKQKSGYWDSESLDFPIYFNPADNEGYVDDGQLNIIMLGDETVGNVEDSSSLAYKVKEITGGNVMSAQYEGMTFSISEKTYNIPEDAFSTYYFVTCLINNDFYLAENALNSMSDDIKQKYSDFLYWARYLDYSTADIIVLCAGRNDYLLGRPLEGEDKYSEQEFGTPNSISGGLDLTIKMLRATYPNAQIIVCSPSFFLTEDENGQLVGADVKNNGNGGVGEYIVNMANVAQQDSVTFVDNYFGIKFNASNYEEYIDENGNPNDKANQLIAEHLTNYFYYNLEKGAK